MSETSSLNESSESNEKRRSIRKNYKVLMDNLKEHRNDQEYMNQNDEEANELFQDVLKPREALYDSALLSMKVSIFHQQTQAIQAGLIEFKAEEFADRLMTQIEETSGIRNDSRNIFEELGRMSQKVISTPPSFNPLNTCLNAHLTPQQKKERQVRQKDKLGEVKRPTLVNSITSSDKEATEIAESILHTLHVAYKENGHKPIGYFKFVTNPASFSETVENMFYVSVLAREASVKIFPNKKELPVIEPIEIGKATALKRDGKYAQAIISIDKADFEKIVKSFKIKGPPMISRKK